MQLRALVPVRCVAAVVALRGPGCAEIRTPATRNTGTIAWSLRPIDTEQPRRGLALLPPASSLDVFLDLEGFPYAERGLEYLIGATTIATDGKLAFDDWWAHDEPEERVAFEGFIAVSYTHLRAPRDRTRSRMPSSA